MAIPTINDSFPVAPLENLFNLIGDGSEADLAAETAARTAADTAITTVRQIKTYKVANAAALSGIAGPSEGDIADVADTNLAYRYSGTAWVVFSTPADGLSAINTASQAIGTTNTDITFPTATSTISVRGAMTFNPATGVATVGTAGTYLVNATIPFNAAAAGARVVGVVKNATQIQTSIQVNSNIVTVHLNHSIVCAVGDTIKITGLSSPATSIGVAGNAYYQSLDISYVGA